MKKSALKEYIREEIIKTLSEMDAYQVTGKTGKKTVASFQSQGEANKFKQQNPNIVSVEKLEEKKEEEDVEVKDDYHKVDDEDGDKDKEPSKSELKKVDKSTKGLAKAKDERALLTREMNALAKKYKEAKGEEKAMIFTNLSKKTALKNELEAIVYPKSQSEIY